jgi:hypothetical protein
MRWIGVLVTGLVCASAYAMVGCVGELKELLPSDDMSGSALPDLPVGPKEMGPSGIKFFPTIQADLTSKNCGIGGCHLNSTPLPGFVKSPATPADEDLNYTSFSTAALNLNGTTDPDQSQVLKVMLPGGGHGGGTMLASKTDPMYVRWRAWIADGGPR